MEVMSPASKNLQTFLVNKMLVYVDREFKHRHRIPADEVSFLFSNLSDAVVKKNMRIHGIVLEVIVRFSLAHKRHGTLSLFFFGVITSVLCYHTDLLHGLKMQRDKNGQIFWYNKHRFDKFPHEIELKNLVAPEDVSLACEFVSC